MFQQGFGNRPLVDEYGVLLRNWLREAGVTVPEGKKGLSKIYLTHDVDEPFRFGRIISVGKQYIKNMLRYNYSEHPFQKFLNEQHDDYNTFSKIINYDKNLQEILSEIPVEIIYFIITAGTFFNQKYYNFFSKKINRLIAFLNTSGAQFGLHISYEAGKKSKLIKVEMERLKDKLKLTVLNSRHHFLQWREPEDVVYMEKAGIAEDFTMSYADCAGFRVGTCRPYRFINPRTKELTNVVVHPFEIMECTLDHKDYMNLDYESALTQCKNIIDQIYKYNGELVLLWHNTEFTGKNYQEKLYVSVLEYIKRFK